MILSAPYLFLRLVDVIVGDFIYSFLRYLAVKRFIQCTVLLYYT